MQIINKQMQFQAKRIDGVEGQFLSQVPVNQNYKILFNNLEDDVSSMNNRTDVMFSHRTQKYDTLNEEKEERKFKK